MNKDVVIIGGGVSGLTAAIYLARANFNVKVLTGYHYGALSETPLIENFPGFPDGISGMELIEKIMQQAEKCGVEIIDDKAEKIDIVSNAVLSDSDETYHYSHLIIATGTKPRKLTAKNANKYDCKGIHYCATCDGVVYKDKDVCVVGGGNTALTEALYLSNICKTVSVVVRKDKFKADQYLIDAINKKTNIIKLMKSEIVECVGEEKLKSVIININGKISSYLIDGIFVAIGSDKNDEILKESICQNYDMLTLPDNIKFCGDLVESKHQAVIAAGSGAKVAMEIIEKYY